MPPPLALEWIDGAETEDRRQRIQRLAPFAQQQRIGQIILRQAIAIMAVDPFVQRREQPLVHHYAWVNRPQLLLVKRHPQPQAGWAAAVAHAFTQVEHANFIDRPPLPTMSLR